MPWERLWPDVQGNRGPNLGGFSVEEEHGRGIVGGRGARKEMPGTKMSVQGRFCTG